MWEVIIEAIIIWAIGLLPAVIIVKRAYLKWKGDGKRYYYKSLTIDQINNDAMQLAIIWPVLLIGFISVLLYGVCFELVKRIK